MKKFVRIAKKTQEELKTYLESTLKMTYGYEVINGDGYLYAPGEIPVLLVAHLDTVHKEVPKNVYYDTNTGAISSPQGIGGDDRCGVYMILKIIKKHRCHVLFCEDEEVGAKGAQKFIKAECAEGLEFNYMIELDRMNSNDAVFYDCDNPEFEEFITQEFYETSWGSFSDISYLAPHFGCAAVNLSCGYYSAHTLKEYVVFSEMLDSIEAVCKILERTTEEDKFEYIEAAYGYGKYWYGSGSYGGSSYDYFYYIIEYVDLDGHVKWEEEYAKNKNEAIGRFCVEHPKIPYENVIEVCYESSY